MFKFTNKVKCWWPVKVMVPSETVPGTFEEQVFEAEFQLQDRDEAKASREKRAALIIGLQAAVSEGDLERATAAQAELDAFDDAEFKSSISDWRGIEGEHGPFAFSPDNLAAILRQDNVRIAVSNAYREAIGQDKARLGN